MKKYNEFTGLQKEEDSLDRGLKLVGFGALIATSGVLITIYLMALMTFNAIIQKMLELITF